MRVAPTNGLIFVVSAPSGCGKTSLIKALLKNSKNLVRPVSFTTRPPRRGERNGGDYNFVSWAEFKSRLKRGHFLEWSKPYGHYYATPRDVIEKNIKGGKDVILSLDVKGASFIKRNFKNSVLIYVLPPSLRALKDRLINRSTDDTMEISKRLSFAKKDILNLKRYDYTVINDNFNEAVKALKAILKAERLKVK